MPRILLWDTESSELVGDFGNLLCFGYKWLGDSSIRVLSLKDFPRTFQKNPTDDGELVKAAYKILEAADQWVTWYGKNHDVPFVATRLIEHRHPKLLVLPSVPHVDGWEIARYKMKLHSNRLASVSTFLDIDEKTPIKPTVWRRALSGHIPSLNYVIQHCRRDVKVLEQAYQIIKPLCTTHPNVALMDGRPGCPVCGKNALQRRGTMATTKTRWVRFQCQRCGHWTRESERKANRVTVRTR